MFKCFKLADVMFLLCSARQFDSSVVWEFLSSYNFLLLDDTVNYIMEKGIFVREMSGKFIFQIWQIPCINITLRVV